MNDCIFCGIARGVIESGKVYSGGDVFAFNDINPQAPVHIVVIPSQHIAKLEDAKDPAVFSQIFKAIDIIVKEKGLDKNGYRVVVNSGRDAGQAVPHLHFHILGGRTLNWPPG
ncbi:MAG: histidine triad nucleotide-binding protein [Candidatus Margulisiibacteriota bacterium]